jgi:hypothetical protein
MDVAIATDTPRIAELLGDRFNRGHDIAFGVSFRIELLDFPKSSSSKDCACPCPKIFGGKVLSSYLPQEIVYITRIDRPVLALLIDILKKLLSRQILAMIDDFGQAPIVKVKTKCLATLAAKFKPDFRASHFDVFAPHCGQSERSVVPGVFFVPDAN